MNNELANLTVVILTHKTNTNTLENCLSSIDPKVKINLIENDATPFQMLIILCLYHLA